MGLEGDVEVHVAQVQSGQCGIRLEGLLQKPGVCVCERAGDVVLDEFVPVRFHAVSLLETVVWTHSCKACRERWSHL